MGMDYAGLSTLVFSSSIELFNVLDIIIAAKEYRGPFVYLVWNQVKCLQLQPLLWVNQQQQIKQKLKLATWHFQFFNVMIEWVNFLLQKLKMYANFNKEYKRILRGSVTFFSLLLSKIYGFCCSKWPVGTALKFISSPFGFCSGGTSTNRLYLTFIIHRKIVEIWNSQNKNMCSSYAIC